MAEGTKGVVYAALAGNLAIAATKFGAAAFTGSSAMLTEAIHSLVDTGNQVLLLLGQRRASLEPDEDHPFGHGMETYFWSFIVALMVLVAGGVVAIWQGVHKIAQPEPIDHPWVNFLVLGLSAVMEALSFTAAFREYRRIIRGRDIGLLRFVRISKDPGVFTVLLEDGAALFGLGVAALGVAASVYLNAHWADGLASVTIGLLLVCVAIFMANETRSLIAGEAAAPPIVGAIREVLERETRVETVVELLTLHLGPQSILVALTLRFASQLDRRAVELACSEVVEAVKASDARIGPVYLRPV